MTYNFDPDRWYENQRANLLHRKACGELDEEAYQRELDRLAERYDDMLSRLAGPFELPSRPPGD
jgi:hypothetical protein